MKNSQPLSRKRNKAVILISGNGSNLQAFIDQIAIGKLDMEIQLILSNVPNAFGLERARQANIAQACINHKNFENRLDFDRALIARIDEIKPDIIILAGFMRVLTPEFVKHYPNKLINIHPSLLPKFPGINTHKRALSAGEYWHGASIHFVTPDLDAGPVILQGRLKVHSTDTIESLKQRVHKVEHHLYPLAAQWFCEQRLRIENQKVLLDGEFSAQQLQTFDL